MSSSNITYRKNNPLQTENLNQVFSNSKHLAYSNGKVSIKYIFFKNEKVIQKVAITQARKLTKMTRLGKGYLDLQTNRLFSEMKQKYEQKIIGLIPKKYNITKMPQGQTLLEIANELYQSGNREEGSGLINELLILDQESLIDKGWESNQKKD